MKESEEVVLPCLLDPHYRECCCLPGTINQADAWLREEAKKTASDTKPAETASDQGDPRRQRVEDQAHRLLHSLDDTMATSNSHAVRQPRRSLKS